MTPFPRFLACLLPLFACLSFALVPYAPAEIQPQPRSSYSLRGDPFRVSNPEVEHSDILVPAVSLILPGFGQWLENQHGYGALYSGGAVSGLLYSSYHAQKFLQTSPDREYEDINREFWKGSKDPHVRRVFLGTQTYQLFGSLSAYHSFRSAARTYKSSRYSFLSEEETPADLAMAPFRFSFLQRPTTFVPLGLAAILCAAALATPKEELEKLNKEKNFGRDDLLLSGAYAYNAGLGEEALYRGWFMPVMRAETGNDLYANAITSLVFALSHNDSNMNGFLFHLTGGFYFGYVAQNNDWSIAESIFIHTWWDVLALAASYAVSPLAKEQTSPIIWLPSLQLSF